MSTHTTKLKYETCRVHLQVLETNNTTWDSSDYEPMGQFEL